MSRLLALAFALVSIAAPATSFAGPTANLHQIDWYVHVDLIDVGAGRDLAYYSDLIAEGVAEASDLLKGDQGPFDSPCCNELQVLSVSTFGTPGDGLDVPSSQADLDALDAIRGSTGTGGFLVDSLGWCGGPTSTAIGCANTPPCTGNPNDDPGLTMIVTLEAEEVFDSFGETIAHERGHNSCLTHQSNDECQLMSSVGGGACVTAAECAEFDNGRNATGGSCECHDGAGGTEPDGTSCTEAPITGICSGGLCGETSSDAGVYLMAAGGPEGPTGAATDDALRLSGATGGWTLEGPIGASTAPTGLAYSPGRDVLYAVNPLAGDDELITLDKETGARTGTIGTLTGKADVQALAFDPGPTEDPSDDRLLALVRVGSFEDLFEIDPDDASVTDIAGLATGVTNGFQGLAWDSGNDKLYTTGFAGSGLFEIDLACPFYCSVNQVPGVSLARTNSSLAYSAANGRLYISGAQAGPRSLYDSVDATMFADAGPAIGIDAFTPGGLAAIPVPEPHQLVLQGAGVLALAGFGALRRRRDRRR